MDVKPEIKIEGLRKAYPGGVVALDGIDLTISMGMYGLLGPNGAGKTTLMRIICTLLSPTAGTVTVCGLDGRRESQRVRQVIGYLPQEFGAYARLTAQEYLDLVAGMKGLSGFDPRRQVSEVLEKVNLAGERRTRVGGFSGGMKRRLGIAQALMGNPPILVVDEPTAGLDPEERIRFRNLLTEMSTERIVLLSTHIVGDIESTCTRIAVIQKGRLRFAGSVDALVQAAVGQVWNLEMSGPEYERARSQLKVVSSRRTEQGIILRVLGSTNPLGMGILVPPTLEDGYLCLMEEVVI